MWGKSSNSHLGKSDTTVALILYQKEKINPKRLVHCTSQWFVLGQIVPCRRGRDTQGPPVKDGPWKPQVYPMWWVLLFELKLFIFQPYCSGFDSGSLVILVKSLVQNLSLCENAANPGVGGEPSCVCEPEEAFVSRTGEINTQQQRKLIFLQPETLQK